MQKIESMEKIDCGFNFDKDIKNKKIKAIKNK
jgi:hypothetical protein